MTDQQRSAVERTVAALEGRIEPSHAVIVELVRGLADAVDRHPDRSTLWREYRGAIEQLAHATAAVEQEDNGQAAFLELVRTPLGDAPDPGAPDPRPASGDGRRAARNAAIAVAEASR